MGVRGYLLLIITRVLYRSEKSEFSVRLLTNSDVLNFDKR